MFIRGLSWSWKRFFGLTQIRQMIARMIGIPTTKDGIQRKVGRILLNMIFKK